MENFLIWWVISLLVLAIGGIILASDSDAVPFGAFMGLFGGVAFIIVSILMLMLVGKELTAKDYEALVIERNELVTMYESADTFELQLHYGNKILDFNERVTRYQKYNDTRYDKYIDDRIDDLELITYSNP